MKVKWISLAVVTVLAGSGILSAAPAGARDPGPDPGYPVVPCTDDSVSITSDSQLDPACTYSGGIEITASDVTLDCRGASVATDKKKGVGILIHTPVDEDMSGVTVRNCAVSGFLNGIRVTRDGFRGLAAGEEYDHSLENVTLEDNTVTGTKGVGIYVDGYVTDTTITDSTVTGAGSSGIYLEAGSADNLVARNQILDNGFGENGPDGQLETFDGLRFRYWGTGREGLSIDGSRRNTIRGNTFQGNSAGGIYLYTNCGEYVNSKPERYFPRRYGATDNLITGNHLIGGVSGVWVGARMGESVLPMDCSDEPYFEQGTTQITLDRAAHNTVTGSTFENVTYGVRVEDDDTTVSGNGFSGADAGQYAVMIGTPYRTSVLGKPVTGTRLVGNESTIAGNPSPYRWVEGEKDTTVSGNTALGEPAGICQSTSIPRGPFVMTIEVAYEPAGSPVTPTPDPLVIPTVGPQEACPADPPPDPPPPDSPTTDPPATGGFRFVKATRDRKHGVTTLVLKVTAPGKLRLRGSKAVRESRATARAAATVRLKVRAKGKAARQLRRRGTVRVKAVVTYTPNGGTARSKTRSVRLIRKKTRRHRIGNRR